MNYRDCLRLLAPLFCTLMMCACDIAPEVRVGDPINDDDPTLDPDDPNNITAYFYTDRPVVGLHYVCSKTVTLITISGKTGTNGEFVCPRDRKVSFYVGNPEAEELKLGEVELHIYGDQAPGEENLDSRANVAITPATLLGTNVDGTTMRIANIYNLLATFNAIPLDEDNEPLSLDRQDKILLTDALHDALSEHLADSPEDFNLDDNDANFSGSIDNHAAAIHALPDVELRMAGASLPASEARSEASAAILAARAGVYNYVPTVYAIDEESETTLQLSFETLVGKLGHTTGMGYYWTIDNSAAEAEHEFVPLEMIEGSGIAANGNLRSDFTFMTESGDGFTMEGGLVNDILYSSIHSLDPENNDKIPPTYATTSSDLGIFSSLDDVFSGDAQMARVPSIEILPDVDLDELPPDTLPAFVRIEYKYYPDGISVSDANRADALAVANSPVEIPCSSGRYTTCVAARTIDVNILPNGDIISDIDGDCDEVEDAGNFYEDTSGTREFLVGQVGNVFQKDSVSYVSLLIAVLDREHPAFGLHIGVEQPNDTPVALPSVVLDINEGILRNKACDPADGECEEAIEIFNTYGFYEEVFKPVIEAIGEEPEEGEEEESFFAKPTYFGLVTASTTVCSPP